MASPFRVFRKYQKTLLVVAGVILMFVFVVGDALIAYLNRSGNGGAGGGEHDARAVAVRWDGGKLTNEQLSDLVYRRRLLNRILQQIEFAGRQSSLKAGVEPPPLRVQMLVGPETPQQGVEDNVVKTKLIADAARAAGMKVSDDTLLQYLDDLGRRNVSREEMRAIVTSPQTGRVSIDYVINALREEMLARNYLSSQVYTFSTVTPQQRWEDWLKVNDRVVIEAAAVPAENYLVDVKEPTDAELTAFFDKYKSVEPGPDLNLLARSGVELPSPTPGFRIPRRIDVQFATVNYNDYLTKAEEQVTEEEITKFYDEHKDLFVKADVDLMEDLKPESDGAKSEQPTGAEGAKSDTEPAPTDGETKSGESEANKAESRPQAPPSESPANETKDGPPPTDSDEKDAAPADEKKSSSRGKPTNGVFRLAAFAEEAEKQDVAAADAAEESAPASSPKPAEAEKAESPGEPSPAAAPPTIAPPANASAETTDGSQAAPEAGTPPAAEKTPVQYQPLSEVKDEIRRRLAEEKVAEQLSNVTGDIQGQLDTVFNKWRFEDVPASQDGKKELPPPPKSLTDWAPIAEKNSLKVERTGSKSLLEMRDTPLGKSRMPETGLALLAVLYSDRELEIYQPTTAVNGETGDRYVLMKTSDTPGREPKLDEVRDEVVKAWKKQKAAELAQKHAEELAKKAQEAHTPLSSFFADDKAIKVVRTDPFAELTGGDVSLIGGQIQQQPYRFSQPSEIVATGPEFLRQVFELKDGQVAVIPNHDRSIAYIVRIVEHQKSLPELRSAYLIDGNSWMGENIMNQMRRRDVAANLERDIERSANLTWVRSPDQESPGEAG